MSYPVVITLLASIAVAFSLYFQKTALDSHDGFNVRKMLTSHRWMTGVVIGLIASASYIWALSMERVALLQPIIDSSVIFSIIISHLLLDDDVTYNEGLSILLVATGMAILVI